MKLKSILLNNVRSHKNNEINFNKGITVLTGRTGSGKSSILMGVDYALFGSENLNNNEIMRRGSKEMLIKLEFEHKEKNYTIIRGLKRSNNKISIDFNNLKVLEEEKQLNTLSRAGDVNTIISEILGIPENVKASQMFQVTSYTKQDEIRKILEMKKEERQDYIDRILQLSRYKTTFENLKKVTDYFESKNKEINKTLEFLNNEKKEHESIRKRIKEVEEEREDNTKKLSVLERALSEKLKEKEKLKREIQELEEKVISAKEKQSEVKSLKEQTENISKELKNLEKNKSNIESKINKKLSIEKVEEELKKLRTSMGIAEGKIKDLDREEAEITKIGGKCPTCKQIINEKHKEELLEKLKNKRLELDKELEKKKQIALLEDELKLLKEMEEFNNKLSYQSKLFTDLNNKLKSIKLVDASVKEKELNNLKKDYEKLIDKDKELYSKKNSINEVLNYLSKELKDLKKEYESKSESINKYEEEVKDKNIIDYLSKFLNNLRGYVKDVRSVIRQKFLSDFRYEFQKKFEEIRDQEEEYSVELGFDYEPTAYTTKGEEVPVNHLSGGEKTSVALAYRLALSNLAASMSNVSPAELLILDEPTTGFDAEDIKSLPEALKNITSIPQIVIVTHEPLLKEIADNNVEIRKERNESIIEY